jgi:hypothetical protein
MADERREKTEEETVEREQEERERDQPDDSEPWAKTGSGDKETWTGDDDDSGD